MRDVMVPGCEGARVPAPPPVVRQTGIAMQPGVETTASLPNSTVRVALSLPISRSLKIMAVVVFLFIVGATANRLQQMRKLTVSETHLQMSQLAMVFAEQTGRAVETVDFIMRGVAEQYGAQDPQLTADTVYRRMAGVRQMLALDIADAHGRVLLSSRTPREASLPQVGLDLLRQPEAAADNALQISDPMRGPNGGWTAVVMRNLPGGRAAGVVTATLNLAYFEDFYRAVALNDNGAILLHRRDGTVLARFPHDDRVIGTSYAELPPFRDILSKSNAGTVEMASPTDNATRILAIRALKAFPLAVNISVDESMVLANWRRQTWEFAAAGLVFTLALATLLFQLVRRSREIETVMGSLHQARDAAETAHRDVLVQMKERERAEAALRQAQRAEAVGQLTGGVAHDFNNLLTVVLGNIDLIEDSAEAEPFLGHLATMRSAAERGANLTGQMLAFARRQPLMPRAVDLNTLIADMQPLLASAVGSFIPIKLELAPGLERARVDPTQLELVVLNLAINARDAMAQGGLLTLATGLVTLPESDAPDAPNAGRYAQLSVTDTGTGMTAEVLERAFEPFFTTKGPGAGSGLGLSQVYGMARQSGGTVTIDSELGYGTTIHLFLPLATGVDALAVAPTHAPGAIPARRSTLLVVDDDSDVRTTTTRLLRRQGYSVIEAADATSALELMRDNPDIDLLLTDVVMPEINGPELGRLARLLRPALPVVFISGYADPESITGPKPLGRLLRKPFRPAELTHEIESALASV